MVSFLSVLLVVRVTAESLREQKEEGWVAGWDVLWFSATVITPSAQTDPARQGKCRI